MAGMLKVRRSRGAFSGILLILLGVWGGLVPLVGPYVHYAYTPAHAWTLTSGRIWLEILPAAATLLGGVVVLASRLRPVAVLGCCLALASGTWFALGNLLAPLWTASSAAQGTPVGGQLARMLEQIGFFYGLGVVIICVASMALGRLTVVSVRDSATRPATTGTPSATPSAAPSATPAGSGTRSAPPASLTPVARGARSSGRSWLGNARTARSAELADDDSTTPVSIEKESAAAGSGKG
jgi:hypothetical protein